MSPEELGKIYVFDKDSVFIRYQSRKNQYEFTIRDSQNQFIKGISNHVPKMAVEEEIQLQAYELIRAYREGVFQHTDSADIFPQN